MSRMKKWFGYLLIVTMLVVPIPWVDAQTVTDIEGHWAQQQIETAMHNGLVNGYEDGTFRPEAQISRAEFFALVNRVLGLYDTGAQLPPDVDELAWYANDVKMAVTYGYVQGDADGNALPENNITRQEACVILARAFHLSGGDVSMLTDGDVIADWAKAGVAALTGDGIISGYEDGSFRPAENLTRAQAAAILTKLAPTVYSNEVLEDAKTLTGNVIIRSSGVEIRNSSIDGNLYIMPGVKQGEAILDNTIVSGRVVVLSTGWTMLKHVQMAGLDIYAAGEVAISGTSATYDTRLYSACTLNTGALNEQTLDPVHVITDGAVSLRGKFGTVQMEQSGGNLTLLEQSSMQMLMISAENCTVTAASNVTNLKVTADGFTMNGQAVENGFDGINTIAPQDLTPDITDEEHTQATPKPVIIAGGGGGGGGRPSGGSGTQTEEAALDSLELLMNGEKVPFDQPFASDTLRYTVSVPFATTSFIVQASAKENGSIINIDGTVAKDGKAEVAFTGKETAAIAIKVLYNNRTRTYTINIRRLPEVDDTVLAQINQILRADTPDMDEITVELLIDCGLDGVVDTSLSYYHEALLDKRTRLDRDLTGDEAQAAIDAGDVLSKLNEDISKITINDIEKLGLDISDLHEFEIPQIANYVDETVTIVGVENAIETIQKNRPVVDAITKAPYAMTIDDLDMLAIAYETPDNLPLYRQAVADLDGNEGITAVTIGEAVMQVDAQDFDMNNFIKNGNFVRGGEGWSAGTYVDAAGKPVITFFDGKAHIKSPGDMGDVGVNALAAPNGYSFITKDGVQYTVSADIGKDTQEGYMMMCFRGPLSYNSWDGNSWFQTTNYLQNQPAGNYQHTQTIEGGYVVGNENRTTLTYGGEIYTTARVAFIPKAAGNFTFDNIRFTLDSVVQSKILLTGLYIDGNEIVSNTNRLSYELPADSMEAELDLQVTDGAEVCIATDYDFRKDMSEQAYGNPGNTVLLSESQLPPVGGVSVIGIKVSLPGETDTNHANYYKLVLTRPSIESGSANLTDIEVTGGILSPVFTPGTLSYAVVADNGNVTLNPVAEDPTAEMVVTVNNEEISGLPVAITEFPAEVSIAMRAGTQRKTYTVIVTSVADVAALESLTVDGAFNPDGTPFTFMPDADSKAVIPYNQVFRIGAVPVGSGTVTVKLDDGEEMQLPPDGTLVAPTEVEGLDEKQLSQTVTVTVSSESGNVIKEYTVQLRRQFEINADSVVTWTKNEDGSSDWYTYGLRNATITYNEATGETMVNAPDGDGYGGGWGGFESGVFRIKPGKKYKMSFQLAINPAADLVRVFPGIINQSNTGNIAGGIDITSRFSEDDTFVTVEQEYAAGSLDPDSGNNIHIVVSFDQVPGTFIIKDMKFVEVD